MAFKGWLAERLGMGLSAEEKRLNEIRKGTAEQKKLDARDRDYAAVDSAIPTVDALGGNTETAGKAKPSFVASALGKLSALNYPTPLIASTVHNSKRLNDRGESIWDTPMDDPAVQAELARKGLDTPWEALKSGFTRGGGERMAIAKKEGYKDPADEYRKMIQGREYEGGVNMMEDLGSKNKAVNFVGGVGFEMLTDPESRLKVGYSALAKGNADDAMKAVAASGITPELMERLGLDGLKYGADIKQALDAGEAVSHVANKQLAQDVAAGLLREAGEAVAGTTQKVGNLPFLRKAGDKKGIEILSPWVRKVDDAERAIAGSLKNPTIGAIIKSKVGYVPSVKRLSTLGDAAGTGESIALGKRVLQADRGGIKMGADTIYDLSPALGKVATSVGNRLRAVPGITKAAGLIDPLAEVRRSMNPLMVANAKGLLRDLASGNSEVRQAAVEAGKNISMLVDPKERSQMSIAAGDIIADDVVDTAFVMQKEQRRIEAESRAFAQTYKVDVNDPEAMAAARLEVSRNADKVDYKIGAVEMAERLLRSEVKDIVDALPANAGRTATSVGKRAGFKAGQAKGTETAVREVDGTISAAEREYERLAEAVSRQGAKADELVGGTGTAAKTTIADTLAAKVAPRQRVGRDRDAWGTKEFWEALDAPPADGSLHEFTSAELIPDIKKIIGAKEGDISNDVLNATPVRIINKKLAEELGATEPAFYAPSAGKDEFWGDAIYLVPEQMDDPTKTPLDYLLHELNHALRTENMRLDPEAVGHILSTEEQQAWRMSEGVTRAIDRRRAAATPKPRGTMAERAGVLPDEPRTAPSLTPKGARKRHQTWQASVADAVKVDGAQNREPDILDVIQEMYGERGIKPQLSNVSGKGRGAPTEEWRRSMFGLVPKHSDSPTLDEVAGQIADDYRSGLDPDFTTGYDVMDAVTAAKEARKRASIDSIAKYAAENPDQTLDILVGRVNEALDADDLKAAELYAAHIDDLAAHWEAPRVDPMADNPFDAQMVSGPKLADSLSQPLPDVAGRLARAKAPTPAQIERVKRVAMSTQERLQAAYKSGRATGAQEAMRSAARAAVRAEARSAAAEGRRANYLATIGGLKTDAERFEAAAEVLRRHETDLRNLAERRRVLTSKLGPAQAPVRAFDTEAGIAALNEESAPAIENLTREYVQKNIKYEAMHKRLVETGVDAPRAQQLVDIERDLDAYSEVVAEARKASGTWDEKAVGDKMAPFSGGAGYMPGAEPKNAGLAEDLLHALIPDNKEANTPFSRFMQGLRESGTPEERRIRNEVITEMTDVDPTTLTRKSDKFAQQVPSTTPGVKPKKVEAADHRSVQDRLKAGLETETDRAVLHARMIEDSGRSINKAKFEDRLMSSSGARVLKSSDSQVAEGMVAYETTRNGVKEYHEVPEQYAKWADGLERIYSNDESTKAWVRGYDRVLNGLKRQMTSWNPAFHGRNAITNYWMAWADDSANPASWDAAIGIHAVGDSDELFTVAGRTQSAKAWRQEAIGNGVEKSTFGVSEVMETTRQEVTRDARTATPDLWKHPIDTITRVGGDVGTGIENTSRLGVYFANLEKGMSPAAAANQVDRVLYNYSSDVLTDFERTYMKRLVPFYSWMRNNIPRMIEVALTNPSKLTAMQKIRESAWDTAGIDRTQMPQYMEDSFALPVGGSILSPGLPFLDLNILGGNANEIGRTQSSVSPILSLLPQLKSNVDIFTGAQLEQYPGALTDAPGYVQAADAALGGISPWEALKGRLGMEYRTDRDGVERVAMNPYARKVVKEALPFGERFGKIMDRNVGTPLMQRQLNANDAYYWTGIKTAPYDEQKVIDQFLSQRAEELRNRERVLRERQEAQ